MIDEVTINTFLDKRRSKRDNTYPIKLTIYFNGKKKRYSTGVCVTEIQWEKINSKTTRDEAVKKIKENLEIIINKAKNIVKNDLAEFSFRSFERLYYSRKSDLNDVFVAHSVYINRLKEENRFGSAISFNSSLYSLKKFTNKNELRFDDIDVEFLKRYEKWMLSNEKSITSVGIYLRNVRILFNEAIANNIIKSSKYPFGKTKYIIPTGRNIKKAIEKEDISKLFSYQPDGTIYEHMSKDIWMFSYLCSGINLCDILKLKLENIQGNNIIFIRKKTSSSSRAKPLKPITINRNPYIDAIIEKWQNKPYNQGPYIFPILNGIDDKSKEYLTIKQFTKIINHHIDKIAKAIGIEKKVTTYTARHSFATILKRAGAPIEYISESLGHSNLKVTENYLDSFDDDTRTKYSMELTNFLNDLKDENSKIRK